MNPQQMFDISASHILRQGRKSKERGVCMYRGTKGTKCAIGCLIPDELYKASMEGKSISVLSTEAGYKALASFIPDVSLAQALQVVHDRQPVEQWRERLTDLARAHGLNPSVALHFVLHS